MKKRKQLGYTQQKIADCLNVSFQAVSKWENGTAYPDISLLPQLAHILGTTTDTLLGYSAAPVTDYEKRYGNEAYYWGLQPNELCYEIMKIKPPVKPYRVLEIGCGEGKDAVFLAKTAILLLPSTPHRQGLTRRAVWQSGTGYRLISFRRMCWITDQTLPSTLCFPAGYSTISRESCGEK